MESKHKNALIGALLAVVFVMAVGYAAFAQLLTINGTATIDSNWDVHFDPSLTAGTVSHKGGNENPSGTIGYADSNTTANLTANLKQPGDEITFVLKPTNYGNLAAKSVGDVVIEAGTDETAGTGANQLNIAANGQSATKGNIKWEITEFTPKTSLAGAGTSTVTDANQDTITIKASFIGGETGSVASGQSANIKIKMNYNQA